jgi:hypothetical protein
LTSDFSKFKDRWVISSILYLNIKERVKESVYATINYDIVYLDHPNYWRIKRIEMGNEQRESV